MWYTVPMKRLTKKPRVAVAMSGGVDSSVTAYLLKKQGYDVVGVMAKFWGDAAHREGGFENTCCSLESRKKGEAIAKKIGIPFYFLDLEIPFKEKVIDTFIDRYESGKTPNPCVSCNREVKIGLLLKKVQELFGARFLATGHYAQIRNGNIYLSKDTFKDQTYFLSRLRREDISHLLFPIGGYTKTQVRAIAKKAGLESDVSAESHELCFFSERTPAQFLQRNIGLKSGKVVDDSGAVIGTHIGAYKYTLGQRKGLNLKIEKAVYISEILPKTNTIKVTYNHDDARLLQYTVEVADFHPLSSVRFPARVQVKLRHSPQFTAARAESTKRGTITLHLETPVRAISSGQIAALYKNSRLLGGGEIVKAE